MTASAHTSAANTTCSALTNVYIPAFALGTIAFITQTVLAREALSAAAGHELMLGVVLTGWLLGQVLCLAATWSLGARLSMSHALIVASVLAPLSLVALRIASLHITPADGTLPTLTAIAPVVLLCTLPAGLGLALSFAAIYHRGRKLLGVSALLQLYAAETTGFMVGGVLWTFALAGNVSHLLALWLIPGVVLATQISYAKKLLPAFVTIIGITVVLLGGMTASRALKSVLTPQLPEGITLVETVDGRHARWQVGEYGGEYSFYRNGRLMSSTGQPGSAAEMALLPLAQVERYSATQSGDTGDVSILYIGARTPGCNEFLDAAESVRVSYLERDTDYAALYKQYAMDDSHSLITLLDSSLLSAVGNHNVGWNAIVLSLGAPTSTEVSWAYDERFLELCKANLHDDGVLVLSLNAEENYNSPALRSMHERVQANLQHVFPQVLVTPPVPVWYIAGNHGAKPTLDPELLEERLDALGISTLHMSRWVLMDRLAAERTASWQALGTIVMPKVSALSLAGLRAELLSADPRLADTLSWLNAQRIWLGIVLTAMLLLPVTLSRRNSRYAQVGSGALAFLGGFTCLAGEIALAWKLQSLSGQLYWLLGLLTALVLGGLFFGTLIVKYLLRSPKMHAALWPLVTAISLALTALVCLHGGYSSATHLALWVLAIIVPLCSGVLIGSALSDTSASPAWIYCCDLLGAALAAIIVGTIGMILWGAAWCSGALVLVWLVVALRAFLPRSVIMTA